MIEDEDARRWLFGDMLMGQVGAQWDGSKWYPYIGFGCRVLRKSFNSTKEAIRYGERVQARYFTYLPGVF